MVTISKWGNSLAIRLPKEALDRARVREGDTFDVEARSGEVVLRARGVTTLKKMVAQITPENLHPELLAGEPAGSEIW